MATLMRALIPDDDTGDVLRQMLDDGDDLSQPRDIAFHLVFATEAQAAAFAAQAALLPDLRIDAPVVDEEGIWEVTATRNMPAMHGVITVLETLLMRAAEAHAGYPDGWSCSAPGDGPDDDAIGSASDADSADNQAE